MTKELSIKKETAISRERVLPPPSWSLYRAIFTGIFGTG